MKKRILAMLLALLMLAPAALTSCSEGTENAETTAADTSAAPTAGEEAAEEVNETDRGAGGFGSTGVK